MKYLALYLRLSIEDNDDKEESNSISNQRKLIYEYIRQNSDLRQYNTVEFCDDGYSGTNMERPEIKKLLDEIKKNNIQCIIVKDISRFARDYIEVGNYLNKIFPFMGVRFISINDNYDSNKCDGNILELDTAFKTLLYDLYSKDISVKVKNGFSVKAANGEYAFGQVPFGYVKSKTEKNRVVVNEAEAKIVRSIFELASKGHGSYQIARKLYEEGVPTIAEMRKLKGAYNNGKIRTWSATAVRNILNNRFYLGEMAYGKTSSKVVGSRIGAHVPRDKWKVIKEHHEAIITEEIYNQVLSFKMVYSNKTKRNKHPLTGKLRCGGCGYAVIYKPLTEKNRYERFECKTHSIMQIPECSTYINAKILEEIILSMINKELMLRGDAIKQKYNLLPIMKSDCASLKKQLSECEYALKNAEADKNGLYEKYAFRELTEEEYRHKVEGLTETIKELSEKENELNIKLIELDNACRRIDEDMKQIIRYSHIEELTEEILDAFVRVIYVYKGKKVEIEWNFTEN